jgi:uncharacterized lipoprotein YmbA
MQSRLLIPLGATVMMLMAGCASSPPVRHYGLTPLATSSGATADERTVVVGPFRLAEYLDRPQIVTRDAGNGITIAEFERWAEPLDAGFQRVVTANLTELLGSTRVLEFPAQAIATPEVRLSGRIARFDVDAEGRAILEVQWGTADAEGKHLSAGKRSRYQAQAAGSDYTARVAALNDTVLQFSQDVAGAMR